MEFDSHRLYSSATLKKLVQVYLPEEFVSLNWSCHGNDYLKNIQNLLESSCGELRMYSSPQRLLNELKVFGSYPGAFPHIGVPITDHYVGNVNFHSDFKKKRTCEGDFCIAIRSGAFTTLRMTRTCVSGVKMPPYPCSLQWDDEMTCYCKNDYCNTDKLFWSNFTEFPVISCKQVHNRKYMMVSCNKCLRIISYVKNRIGMSHSDEEDHVACSVLGDSGDFVDYTNSFKEEMIARSFFVNGCYNTSMHKDNYYVYCRCTQPDCNSPEVPIPYPLPAPSISCFTSGFDAYAYPEKYEKPMENWFVDNYRKLMANDSYVDPNSVCRGQFCFVATVAADSGENEMDIYYKGCISANETGENRIQLGYMYLNEIAYHICNTDYCNMNREVALKEAKDSTIKVVRSIEKVDKNNVERLNLHLILLIILIFL